MIKSARCCVKVRINSSVIGDGGGALESADSGSLLLPAKSLGLQPSGDPNALPAPSTIADAKGAS